MQARTNVVVIGSTNMDLVVKAPRFPRPGETMAGEAFYTSFGGKGANQAVTVARLGVPASFVGCVGDDTFGEKMVNHLSEEGIDTNCIRKIGDCSSGTAVIVVDSDGRNQIIVVRGANARLHPEDIDCALPLIASAKLAVIQLEIPLDTVEHAIEVAHQQGTPIILNPAPAPAKPLPSGLLQRIFLVAPNEVEAEALTGLSADSPDFPQEAIRALHQQGAHKIIITLGQKGCAFSEGARALQLQAYQVRPEDTTGAGDAFVGALAAGYSFFSSFINLVKFASAVAALSVTKRGAQSSLPRRGDVRDFLQRHEPGLLAEFLKME